MCKARLIFAAHQPDVFAAFSSHEGKHNFSGGTIHAGVNTP